MNIDLQFQDLLRRVLDAGFLKKDQDGNDVKAGFGYRIQHVMSEGFPLLTTVETNWKNIVVELLWSLRGDTNIKYLVDNGCNTLNTSTYKIFQRKAALKMTEEEFIEKIKTDDEFAQRQGDLGPVQSKQWRDWGGKIETRLSEERTPEGYLKYEHSHIKGVDQIENLIRKLKADPDNGKLLLNSWNVGELEKMDLLPSAYGFQVWTRELSSQEIANIPEKLNPPKRTISMMWSQCSVNAFDLPSSIASHALLLSMLAEECNMIPEILIGNFGEIYLDMDSSEQARELLSRTPMKLPSLCINSEFWLTESEECGIGSLNSNLRGLEIDDFQLEN
jgi:thymidylate synthase